MATALARLPTGTVTFLFTDIEGSTTLLGMLGDRYADVLARHRSALRGAFERFGGVEFGTAGDAFFVAFARAPDAIAAAAAGQAALAAADWPGGAAVRVRAGVHTGAPAISEEGYVGMALHEVARIMSAGHGGQVVVSQATRDLVGDDLPDGVRMRDLGDHLLKDLPGPQRLFDLVIDELDHVFPPLRTIEHRPTNLPAQPGELLGRGAELDALVALLAGGGHPVVTLTGPGGVGKTRLAIAAAAELVEQMPGGAWFVGLAAVNAPELVLPAVAQAIGAPSPAADGLRSHLADREAVIVLDNCEHVLAAAPAIAELARAAPGVRWLATSRAPLRISGEHEVSLDPLATPASDDLEGARACGAVQLFVDRAAAIVPGFRLDESNAATVAALCRELDGLPLAIELAAARLRILSPEALLERLTDRLGLLTGGLRDAPERQRTLRATIAWSHELLADRDRTLLARLAAFDGGWTVDAAEAVCGGDGLDVLDGLASLAENSLIRRGDPGHDVPRFWMLESIRAFAVEQFATLPDRDQVARRHTAFYRAYADEVQLAWLSAESVRLGRTLDADVGNFAAAIARCIEAGDLEAAAAITGELGWLWQHALRGEQSDRIAGRLLADRAALSERTTGLLLLTRAAVALDMGRHDDARADLVEAVELLEAGGEPAPAAFASKSLAWILLGRQQHDEARRWFDNAARLAGGIGADAVSFEVEFGFAALAATAGNMDTAAAHVARGLEVADGLGQAFQLYARSQAGEWELMRGRYDEALALFEQAWQDAVDVGDHRVVPALVLGTATAHLYREDFAAAGAVLAEALPLAHERGALSELASGLLLAARIATATGEPVTAAELLGASRAIRQRVGAELAAHEAGIDEAVSAATREHAAAREHGGAPGFRGFELAMSCLDVDEA